MHGPDLMGDNGQSGFVIPPAELLAQVHDAIIATDTNGIVRSWNPGAERLYGYTAAEMLGRDIRTLHFPEDLPNVDQSVLLPLRSSSVNQLTTRRRRKDGRSVIVSLRLRVIHDSSGQPVGTVGCSHDITALLQSQEALQKTLDNLEAHVAERTRDLSTANQRLESEIQERRRIETALRASEERLRHLLRRSPGVLYSCEPRENFPATFVSENMAATFGFAAEAFLRDPKFWIEHVHPDDRERVFAQIDRGGDEGQWVVEYRFRHASGEYRQVRDSTVVVRDDAGRVIEFVGHMADITEEKLASEAKREQERLRFLAEALITAQEAERKRISLELHDDLNQRLATLILEIGILQRNPPRTGAELRARLSALKTQSAQISDEVRRIALQLHSAGLEQFGLRAALEQECATLSGLAGMKITFRCKSAPENLPPHVALCLYRVTQECLRNVVKHSGAGRAAVSLGVRRSCIRLYIADRGAGFDLEKIRARKSLGLISIHERVREVGGTVRLDSGPGRGTRVEILVPWKKHSQREAS